MSDAPETDKVLPWLNDRLGHDVEAQVLLALPGKPGPHGQEFMSILYVRGALSYPDPQEIEDAPYPLTGHYLIGDGVGGLSLSDLLPRANHVMSYRSQLGMHLAADTMLRVRDLTYEAARDAGGVA